MDKNIFKQEFKVHYYEIDKMQNATPSSIIQYVEDVSMGHSIKIGYGLDTLFKMGLCWIVNKWHVKMNRYPKWDEKIILETWVCNYERFFAKRDYRILSLNGDVLANITARWIFYNFKRKRPVRILPEIIEGYNAVDKHAVKDDFKKVKLPDDWEFEKNYNVRRSDIDTNKHVNNIKYIEWLIDTVPEEVYENGWLKEFEITYNKESGLDSIIQSKIKETNKTQSQYEYLHGIYDEIDSVNLASAKSVWGI